MRKKSLSRQRGFTLIELLIVIVIVGVMTLIGIPVLRGILIQSQMVTFGSQIQSAMQRARFEAIKTGFPVVVQLQPNERAVRAYVDIPALDIDGARTDTPFVFEPVDGLSFRETDNVLFTIQLPRAADFIAPAAEPVVDGMTNISGGAPDEAEASERVLVFNPDGSAATLGAFRFGDQQLGMNFLEARVQFVASGKMVLQKYDCNDDVWRRKDDDVDDGKAWTWYQFGDSC